MSNNPFGPYDSQQNSQWGSEPQPGQNPFAQGRYGQSPYDSAPGPYADDPLAQSPYPPVQPSPYSQQQVQRYRHAATPPALRPYEQLNTINHFASAFFPVVGLVMFFLEKGKNPTYDKHLRETLNMALTRIAIGTAGFLASGWIASIIGIASFAYFVLAILGAVEGTKAFKEGRGHEYKGAIPFTRPDN